MAIPARPSCGSALASPLRSRSLSPAAPRQPEESAALDAYVALRRTHPELRLIVVPRHKERFDEVARLIESRGLPLLRRSQAAAVTARPGSQPPVFLLDTLGELAACWGLADVAFVGGSLSNRGGQNMIEPAGYGATLLFGPNTQNFRDVVELLLTENAARVVRDAAELATALAQCLADPARRRRQEPVLKSSSSHSREPPRAPSTFLPAFRALHVARARRRLIQSRLSGFRIGTRI